MGPAWGALLSGDPPWRNRLKETEETEAGMEVSLISRRHLLMGLMRSRVRSGWRVAARTKRVPGSSTLLDFLLFVLTGSAKGRCPPLRRLKCLAQKDGRGPETNENKRVWSTYYVY